MYCTSFNIWLHTAVQTYNAAFSEGRSNSLQTAIQSCTCARFGTVTDNKPNPITDVFKHKPPAQLEHNG